MNKNDLVIVTPKNFYNKKYNEEFIKIIMNSTLKNHYWKAGDPNKREPDYFCDDIPFEFTLASYNKSESHPYDFIKEYRLGLYSSKDVEKDAFEIIECSIEKKSTKSYSTQNNHLCVLCMLDISGRALEKDSLFLKLLNSRRKEFFLKIKETYIDTGIFNNIFIIFPDSMTNWWVWDILKDHKSKTFLYPEQLINGSYPFVCSRNYIEILKEKNTDGLLTSLINFLESFFLINDFSSEQSSKNQNNDQ